MKIFYKSKAKQLLTGICLFGLLGFSTLYAQERQEEWKQIYPPGTPEARRQQTMVTLDNGKTYMYGGTDAEAADLFNDLYEFKQNKDTIPLSV